MTTALCSLALASCSMSRSAERQDSFGQEVESRRDEGAVKVTTTVREYAPPKEVVPSEPERERRSRERESNDVGLSVTQGVAVEAGRGPLIKETVTVEDRAPVVSTTTTTTKASGEAHSASAQRFGWSPWTIAIGLAVAAALAYGAFWVKRKLAL